MWSGIVLAPVAWLCAEGVGYVVASRTCEGSVEPEHARIADVVICVVCIIVATLGLVAAIGNARVAAQGPERAPTLLSFGGAFSSALFTAGIILFALPAAFVNACNQVR
jgi:hypothetical protein